jgi:lipopolysaccharide export LptBFGC system permease protein LptF
LAARRLRAVRARAPLRRASRASRPLLQNQQARQQVLPQIPQFAQPNVTSVCSSSNNVCNTDNSYTDNSSYVDNSVYAPDNSYTNTVTDNSVFNAPTTVTVAQDDHSAKVIYANEDQPKHNNNYEYPSFPTYNQPNYPVYQPQQYQYQAQYQQPMPVYQQPISYNKPAPYVTLKSVPYTGLDLGFWGTIAYWIFLVLWCFAAAYFIVVKRVQNKLVRFLNGFLFGKNVTAAATHTPAAPKAAAKTETDMGIDPFIASQIKRA